MTVQRERQGTKDLPIKPFKMLRCRTRGIEAVEADTALVFGRHTHAQFGIGLICRGAQKSASGCGPIEAVAGDVITVNPGEVHDGAPIGDGGRSWRMLYLDPDVVAELRADIDEGPSTRTCEFTRPMIKDPRTASRFSALFRAVTACDDALSGLRAEEALLRLMADLLQPLSRAETSVPSGIALARSWIDDDPVADLTLGSLANEAGLSRYQFLRRFMRLTGLTPHAYLMQQRIHLARRLIGRGVRLTDAAAASGFADQSHMTRLFVRSFGMTPGTYARSSC